MHSRKYELIVFGATGFTGKYTCEHIVSHLPTDLMWAVAGRSESKLQCLVDELRSSNPDRVAPEIVVSGLDKQSVSHMVRQTKVIINAVGPYLLYAEPVVEACAQSGTHYLDLSGESPWILEMIEKYHTIAQENKAIIIPQCGVQSAAPDLLSWSMVTLARQTLRAGISELVLSVYDLDNISSGGSNATVLGLLDKYSIQQTLSAMKPWSLCPIAPPPSSLETSTFFQKLFGVRVVRDLGTLTTGVMGVTDTTIVNRSWGLFDKGQLYGSRFKFSAWSHTRNRLTGVLMHITLMLVATLGLLALSIPFVRSYLRKFATPPGQGASKEASKNNRVEYRALATADSADADSKRITGRMVWEGSLYHLSGIFLSEAAITIARDNTPAIHMGGGLLTPATLGAPFLERMQKAGLKVDVGSMP